MGTPDDAEKKPFNLPKHTPNEECYEDTFTDDNGASHEIDPMTKADTGSQPHLVETRDVRKVVHVQSSFNSAGRKETKMRARKSSWVHNLIYLNGEKFDFTGREYLTPIYDSSSRQILLKTGRQVEKTTMLANNLSVMCSIIPFFKCLYVSPSHVQTRTFSNEKLKPILERSPLIRRYLQNNKVSTQVFEKGFTNGAFIFLRSAFLSADRCLAKGSLVSLRRGRIPIEDVRPGEYTLSYHKGLNASGRVLGVSSNGVKPTLSVKLINGLEVKATINHKFITNTGDVYAEDLTVEHYIPIPINFIPEEPRTNSDFKPHVRERTLDIGIPEVFFSNRKDISAALRGLFEGDGWCTYNKSSRQCEVGLSSESSTLVRDIQYGLQGLGIYSILEEKQPHDKQKDVHYTIKIRNIYYIKVFSKEVGFINKQAKLDNLLKFAEGLNDKLIRSLDVPFRTLCNNALKTLNISLHSLWSEHQISFRNNSNTKECITRHKAKQISELTGCTILKEALREDFLWVPIKSTTHAENLPTYDIEVETYENFTVNGMITHNSRGISADLLCCDEVQDLILSNLPIIQQCLSHSKYAYQIFAGTPKSSDNCIEQLWENTSQNEWMVRCSGCNKWNFLDNSNIGLRGPICKYCGKDLNVRNGQWASGKSDMMWKGFRIPQLMVPWIAEKDSDSWKQLVHQKEHYPDAQFFNEVLGLSYDNASKPVTRADLLMNCKEDNWFISPHSMSIKDTTMAKRMKLFAGVDWGEGNDGTGKDIMGKIRNASYTVLTIGGFATEKKFKVIYIKRYEGREVDPDFIVKDIVKICKRLGVKMIGSDWGHGWGVNNQLFRQYGPQRCVQFMYIDNQKEVKKWDPIGYKYQLQRNHVMSELFYKFKNSEMSFPPLELWEEFAKDIFAISVEYIEYQRKLRYIHRPSDPDDFFHSLLYCRQVADIFYGNR